jgi:hypothetical protein
MVKLIMSNLKLANALSQLANKKKSEGTYYLRLGLP